MCRCTWILYTQDKKDRDAATLRLKAQTNDECPRRHYQHVIAMLISSGDSIYQPISVEITNGLNLPYGLVPRSLATCGCAFVHKVASTCPAHAMISVRYISMSHNVQGRVMFLAPLDSLPRPSVAIMQTDHNRLSRAGPGSMPPGV